MITLLYGCAQVETCVRDMDEATRFMREVLGGGPIEERMAQEICDLFPGGEHKLAHVGLGEAVFQLNAPSPASAYRGNRSTHQAYLERVGPCVTNLNYYVDDAEHAHELLSGMGAATCIEGPATVIPCFTDYGDNTRTLEGEPKFYFMGSRDLIGLDLEFMEPTFKRFTRQTLQYPAYVEPRPAVGDGNLTLQRLRLVVVDLEATWAKLVAIFAPASRSKPYAVRAGRLGRAFRVGLGGVELEYCQPLADGPLAERLARFGPGVDAVEFSARQPERVLGRCEHQAEDDPLGGGAPQRQRIASREIIAFDVVLEPHDPRPLA